MSSISKSTLWKWAPCLLCTPVSWLLSVWNCLCRGSSCGFLTRHWHRCFSVSGETLLVMLPVCLVVFLWRKNPNNCFLLTSSLRFSLWFPSVLSCTANLLLNSVSHFLGSFFFTSFFWMPQIYFSCVKSVQDSGLELSTLPLCYYILIPAVWASALFPAPSPAFVPFWCQSARYISCIISARYLLNVHPMDPVSFHVCCNSEMFSQYYNLFFFVALAYLQREIEQNPWISPLQSLLFLLSEKSQTSWM